MSNNDRCFYFGYTMSREYSWQVELEKLVETKYFIDNNKINCYHCNNPMIVSQHFTSKGKWFTVYCDCRDAEIESIENIIKASKKVKNKILSYKPLSKDIGFICLMDILK